MSQAADPALAGSAPATSRAAGSRQGRARPGAVRPSGHPVRPVAGVLADGTPCYAPIGEVVIVDGSLVICHLCGRQLRSVTAHLEAHGWTKEAYCEAFGLERGQSLEGPETRKLRAAAFTARLVFDASIREGSAAGRDRARAGELARDAAAAARGRRIPEQRRRKAFRSRPPVARRGRPGEPGRAAAPGRGGRAAAAGPGYPDIRAFVLRGRRRRQPGGDQPRGRAAQGLAVPASRRHRSRGRVGRGALRHERSDARWRPALRRLGFPDVPVTCGNGTSFSIRPSTPSPPRSASPPCGRVRAPPPRAGPPRTPPSGTQPASARTVAASLGFAPSPPTSPSAGPGLDLAGDRGRIRAAPTWLRRQAAASDLIAGS